MLLLFVGGKDFGASGLCAISEEGDLCFSAFCLQGRRRRRWSNMTWCVPFLGGEDSDTPTRCLYYSLLFLLPLSWEQEEEKWRTQREAKGALKCKVKLRKAKGSLFVFSLSTCNIHQSATTLKTVTGKVSNTDHVFMIRRVLGNLGPDIHVDVTLIRTVHWNIVVNYNPMKPNNPSTRCDLLLNYKYC